MSKIFISHSSADNAYALALTEWLDREGWSGQYFLDLKRDAIAPGERWEMALRKAARVCEVVILLISRNWLASTWCLDEMRLARHLGKQLIGVLIDPQVTLEEVPDLIKREWQLCYLTIESDRVSFHVSSETVAATDVALSSSGLAKLKLGLERAGLTAEAFPWPPERDPDRAPYRGLKPLEPVDAAVFFGRDAELLDAISQLRVMRDSLTENCFVIVGASGAGKSSFMRAGLMPRLQRDSQHFLVAPIVRPRRSVLEGPEGLVASLDALHLELGVAVSRVTIREELRKTRGLGAVVEALRRRGGQSVDERAPLPTVVIPVDQCEELFVGQGDEVKRFFALIRDEAESGASPDETTRTPFIVVMTIRADSYSELQDKDALAAAPRRLFDLPPIPTALYHTIVEGPARRVREAGGKLAFEPRLTLALLSEARGLDALPLLAYTLEQLYLEHRGENRPLKLEDYDALGRIKGVLEKSVRNAFDDPASNPPIPADAREQRDLLRQAFIPHLVDLDENRQPIRVTAKWTDIPPESRNLVERLVRQRLLVRDSREIADQRVDIVEIAHESLLRHWRDLNEWVAEETGHIRAAGDATRAAARWVEGERRDDDLVLQGARLQNALDLMASKVYGPRLTRNSIGEFLTACKAKQEAIARERQRIVRWRNRAVVAALVVLAGSSVALERLWSLANDSLLSSGKAWVKRAREDLGNDRPYTAYREAGMVLGQGPDATGRRFVPASAPESVEAQTLFEVSSALVADAIADYNYGSPVYSIALSPDKSLLAAGQTKTVTVRSLATGAITATLAGNSNEVHQVLFLDQPSKLVSADIDGDVAFWDLEAHTGVIDCPPLAAQSGYVYGVAYSKTAGLVAVGEGTGAISLWDAASDDLVYRLQNYDQPVISVAFDPTGTRLATGGQRGEVALWSIDRKANPPITLLKTTEGHKGIVFSIEFSADGKEILSAATDDRILAWDGTDLSPKRELPRQTTPMWHADYDDALGAIVTTARDDIIRLYDERSGKPLGSVDQDRGWVYETIADGDELISASDDGHVKNFAMTPALQGVRALPSNEDDVISGAFSDDGKWFASGGRDSGDAQSANVWRIDQSGFTRQCAIATRGSFWQLAFSPDSKALAIASEGGDGVTLWSPETCSRVASLTMPNDDTGFHAIAFSPTAPLIAAAPVAAKDGSRVVLFDLSTHDVVSRGVGHAFDVQALAFHPAGASLASGDSDGRLVIWDVQNSPAPQLAVHATPVNQGNYIKALAFSPDGATLARGADQGDFFLHDFKNLEAPPVHLGDYKGMVNAIAFSHDGKLIAAGADDARLDVWDTASHSLVYDLGALTGIWGPFGFHPTNPWLAFDGGAGVVRVWDMTAGPRREAAREAAQPPQAAPTSAVAPTITARRAASCPAP
ncbi:MAG: TIR domain-containing protein [Roseiarcus sp.]